jgi:hypothetical protein
MIQFSALRSVQPAALAMALLAGWGALSPAAQAAVKFTKIFQAGDIAPGTQSPFLQGYVGAPTISGSKVAFQASFPNEPRPAGTKFDFFGVYKFSNGTLTKQLDSSTIIPNSPNERFGGLNLGAISIQGDEVIVSSFASDATLYRILGLPVPKIKGGVYGVQNGKVSLIADTETLAPNGQKFTGFGFARYQGPTGSYGVSASTGQVVFGASTANIGLFVFRNGAISALIDENTINPLTGGKLGPGGFVYPFNPYAAAVAQFEINGPQIAFLPAFPPAGIGSQDNPHAVFSVQPQQLRSLVSTNDTLPGTPEKSAYFGSASINRNGDLAFSNIVPAISVGLGDRIFLKQQKQIRLIYKIGQPVEGLRAPTLSVNSNTCISGTQVIFSAYTTQLTASPIQNALLVSRGGKVSTLVQSGDQLNGKTVQYISAGYRRYCSGRFFAFTAGFTDGTFGVYRGEILPDMNALLAGQPDPSDE